jgi:hypothetical protein
MRLCVLVGDVVFLGRRVKLLVLAPLAIALCCETPRPFADGGARAVVGVGWCAIGGVLIVEPCVESVSDAVYPVEDGPLVGACHFCE